MVISGAFLVPFVLALIFLVLLLTLRSWVAKLIFFLLTLGAATIAGGVVSLGTGWMLLINATLFIGAGVTALRVRTTGNRIFAIIMIVIGVALVVPAISALSLDATDTFWSTAMRSLEQGWITFGEMLRRVFTST